MTTSPSRPPLLPTSLVGSYAQPDWLIDRAKLAGRFPPRVRAKELWRVDPAYLEQAQDDATLLAIRAQEDAGIDIITDGEMRRESYSNHFATALDGVDIDNPGTALDRSGHPNPVPRIAGPIVRPRPIEVDDVTFLRTHTDHTIKMTVPGPFTMSQQAQNDHYPDAESAAMAYAAAVNGEIKDLHAAGADIVQIDEPYMQARPEAARAYGLAALKAALEGVTGTTAVHICFGYAAIIHERPEGYSFLPELAGCSADQISIETAQSGLDLGVLADLAGKTIILGVIDLSDPEVETADTVAGRVRRAFPYTSPDKITDRHRLRHEVPPPGQRGRKDARHVRCGGHPPRRGVGRGCCSSCSAVLGLTGDPRAGGRLPGGRRGRHRDGVHRRADRPRGRASGDRRPPAQRRRPLARRLPVRPAAPGLLVLRRRVDAARRRPGAAARPGGRPARAGHRRPRSAPTTAGS